MKHFRKPIDKATRADLRALLTGKTTLYAIARARKAVNYANDGVRLLRAIQRLLEVNPDLKAELLRRL